MPGKKTTTKKQSTWVLYKLRVIQAVLLPALHRSRSISRRYLLDWATVLCPEILL